MTTDEIRVRRIRLVVLDHGVAISRHLVRLVINAQEETTLKVWWHAATLFVYFLFFLHYMVANGYI